MASVNDLWYQTDKYTGQKVRTSRYGRGKRWRVTWYDPTGAARSESFDRKTNADRRKRKVESDQLRSEYVDPKLARTTVDQWCSTWIESFVTRRPSTVRQARAHLGQIRAEFGHMRLSAMRPSDVRGWMARLHDEGYARSYLHSLHGRLRQIMADAVHGGLLTQNPCSRRTSPGSGQQRLYIATTDQIWSLHDRMPERYRVAVLLGAFAGLRIAEVCGLRGEDVDTEQAVLYPAVLYPTVQYPAEPLKTETSRTPVPIPRTLASILDSHAAQWGTHVLFTREDGCQLGPSTLGKVFRAAPTQVDGLPHGFRFQDLRHYFASLLIASGTDVKAVQARVRHASAKTTLDTYSHLWPDSDDSTRAAVETALRPRVYPTRTERRSA